MADPGETLIEEIRVALDALVANTEHPTTTNFPAERWSVGKLKKDHLTTPPRIDWVEKGGQFEQPKTSGANAGSILLDAANYEVTIWHTSAENCRATMHNLYLASRDVAGSVNVTFGRYEFVEDANIKLGRKLKLAVTLRLTVSSEVVPTVEIEDHEHEVFLGSEVVC